MLFEVENRWLKMGYVGWVSMPMKHFFFLQALGNYLSFGQGGGRVSSRNDGLTWECQQEKISSESQGDHKDNKGGR